MIWSELKAVIDLWGIKKSIRYTPKDEIALSYAVVWINFDGQVFQVINLSDPTEVDDFETNYRPDASYVDRVKVITAFEIPDKALQCIGAFGETVEDGSCTFQIQIPGDQSLGQGRWIAYGDFEFEQRHFGDRVTGLYITDPDGLIPVDDRPPSWPIIGTFNESDLPGSAPANQKGTVFSGMTLDFQYGVTEAEPIGGFAWIPGGFYITIIAQKADDAPTLAGKTEKAGYRCQMSMDWAKNT